ncbi:DUF92 domain-containing protein [Bacillus salacetis]|uniref:DUF92 domain-containing protein n=1 Tax=Bacillus salacetis TaxID=2315464 RepID=UPI003BA15AFA
MSNQPLLLFIFIVLVSIAGWKTRNLSVSGAVAAVLTGTALALAFSWQGLLVLGVFFATSSFWSKYRIRDKLAIEQKLAKTSKRDWQQVMANGGSAMIFSFLYIWTKDASYMAGAFASISAANADTWASEIGPLSKASPVSIKTWQRAEKGTSGAVSFLGTAASLAGALTIALVSFVMFPETGWKGAVLIVITGFLGSLVDTFLGAYIQVEYMCPSCGMVTEASIHCGGKCKKVKGTYLVNNEFVNFFASLFAGAAAALLLEVII